MLRLYWPDENNPSIIDGYGDPTSDQGWLKRGRRSQQGRSLCHRPVTSRYRAPKLGIGTGTVQRVLMEQPRPFDVDATEAAHAYLGARTIAGCSNAKSLPTRR
jgi:hypothetical protein